MTEAAAALHSFLLAAHHSLEWHIRETMGKSAAEAIALADEIYDAIGMIQPAEPAQETPVDSEGGEA